MATIKQREDVKKLRAILEARYSNPEVFNDGDNYKRRLKFYTGQFTAEGALKVAKEVRAELIGMGVNAESVEAEVTFSSGYHGVNVMPVWKLYYNP